MSLDFLASAARWFLAAVVLGMTVVLLLAAVLPIRRWRDEVGP